jgi:carbonic anhydrase
VGHKIAETGRIGSAETGDSEAGGDAARICRKSGSGLVPYLLMKASEEELRAEIEIKAGFPLNNPVRFYAFRDAAQNVHEQMEKLKSHIWASQDMMIRGFVFDVTDGHSREVKQGCAGLVVDTSKEP